MTVTFLQAIKAMGQYKKVSCVCGGSPVTYQAKGEAWLVNGQFTDYRDFCFSPTQVLYGLWTIEESLPKAIDSTAIAQAEGKIITEDMVNGNDCKSGQCS